MAVDLGLLQPGERLPNARRSPQALEVGEMTVRRALVSLCEAGVLERKRGRDGGTMVASAPRHGVVSEIAVYGVRGRGRRTTSSTSGSSSSAASPTWPRSGERRRLGDLNRSPTR